MALLILLWCLICCTSVHSLEALRETCHTYDATCVPFTSHSGEDVPIRSPFRAPKSPARLKAGVTVVKPVFTDLSGLHFLLQPNKSTQCTHLVQQGGSDGLGAQVHRKLSVLAFARARHHVYVHEPFTSIQHVPLGADFLQRAEAFLGIGDGELGWEDVPGGKTICTVQYCKYNQYLAAVRSDMIRRYWSSPLPKPSPAHISITQPPFLGSDAPPLVVVVAVHIRRGDVLQKAPHRVIHNTYYIETLDALVSALPPDLAPHLHIVVHTDGSPEDVAEVTDRYPHTVLRRGSSVGGGQNTTAAAATAEHSPDDPLAAFHELATSDVLIMGRSSFSWAAGYYCTGIVVYGHNVNELLPVPSWLDVRDDHDRSRLSTFFKQSSTHAFLRSRMRQRVFT